MNEFYQQFKIIFGEEIKDKIGGPLRYKKKDKIGGPLRYKKKDKQGIRPLRSVEQRKVNGKKSVEDGKKKDCVLDGQVELLEFEGDYKENNEKIYKFGAGENNKDFENSLGGLMDDYVGNKICKNNKS